MNWQKCLICILYLPLASANASGGWFTETHPDGAKVTFHEKNVKPFSVVELQQIEGDIDSLLSALPNKLGQQPPRENLLAILDLREQIGQILHPNEERLIATETDLSTRLHLVYNLLGKFPDLRSFNPEHCANYIQRISLEAHLNLNAKTLSKWLNQVVNYTDYLCEKKAQSV